LSYETFTAILNAAEFPFVSDFFQRPIVIPGLDQPPRLPKGYTGTFESANPELAQHYYCQNILPTSEGIQSVGYRQVIPAAPIPATDFDQVIVVRDADENNFLWAPARGKNYIYRADMPDWVSTNPFAGWPANKTIVSRAYVNGRTFVQYEKHDMFEYDSTLNQINPVTLTGINAADIDVIGASNNYLIAVVGITVNWSSLIDNTDFVPSIQTGAGAAIPQDMKGVARAVVPISGGFVIYTTKNAVVALYTNNARAPFVFREISNAGGVPSPEQVSLEASLGYHYSWTTHGLQKISVTTAEVLSNAAMDFLAGRIWEEFNLATLQLTIERLNVDLQVKISYISGRYLVISYGKPTDTAPQTYTHALVYDLGLKRWGKLRVDHVDCFVYPYPNLPGEITNPPAKQSVGFLKTNGQIDLLVMDYRERQDQGVLLLGRYQLVRQKMATYQSVELEGEHQAYPSQVYLIISADGKTNDAPNQLIELSAGADRRVVKYGAPAPGVGSHGAPRTGVNLSLLTIGTFELSTALFTITRHGNR